MALVLSNAVPPPTTEGTDLLEHSTRKKKRTSTEAAGTDCGVDRSRSYRDSLLGNNEAPGDWMEEAEIVDTDSDEETNPGVDDGIPQVRLSKDVKMRIRARWHNALHGRVIGRFVRYPDLLRRLQLLWKTSEFDLLLLGKGWFVVNFKTKVMRCKILSEGPHFYGSNFIHLDRWTPNFDPQRAEITTTMAWVRFPTVSLEYYESP